MLKHELRKIYKEKRQNLSPFFIADASLKICNRLLRLNIWKASYFHTYLTIERQHEVATDPLITLLHAKDKNIIVPKIGQGRSMQHFLLTDATTLKPNTLGIPEPIEGIVVPEEKIDVVFVPLLAFDKLGHRVGYGKGFYDTFLKKCKPDTLKIGLSFFEAENEITDVLPTDIALDLCITPDRNYSFGS